MKKKDWNPNSWSAKTFIKKQQPQWSDANKQKIILCLSKNVQKIQHNCLLVIKKLSHDLPELIAP